MNGTFHEYLFSVPCYFWAGVICQNESLMPTILQVFLGIEYESFTTNFWPIAKVFLLSLGSYYFYGMYVSIGLINAGNKKWLTPQQKNLMSMPRQICTAKSLWKAYYSMVSGIHEDSLFYTYSHSEKPGITI